MIPFPRVCAHGECSPHHIKQRSGVQQRKRHTNPPKEAEVAQHQSVPDYHAVVKRAPVPSRCDGGPEKLFPYRTKDGSIKGKEGTEGWWKAALCVSVCVCVCLCVCVCVCVGVCVCVCVCV